MNSPSRSLPVIRLALLGAALALPAGLSAQSAGPAAAATPPASASADQVIALNPFEVQADKDNSYGALNSNSITAFNTELAKMPISADIFTESFMNDVGATSVEALIETYSSGAGFSGADPGSTAGLQPGDYTSHSYMQLRGFNTPTITRDGFMPLGGFYNPGTDGSAFSSDFDLERIEIINGPQAMLYGSGGPGGVINTVSKQARLGQPVFGSFKFQIDQYGSKLGELDYGASTGDVAVRVAVINQDQDYRRVNIGGVMNGYYGQVAVKLFGNTTIRITGEQTTYNKVDSSSLSLTSATADPRNSDSLAYLLASDQTGPNAVSGAIDNGLLNWDNVNSYAGWLDSETDIDTFGLLTAETQWLPWLSSQFSVGINGFKSDVVGASGLSFYSPQATANSLGGWTMGGTPADLKEPGQNKAIRFSVLATNDLFNDRAHSQSILGADFVRNDGDQIQYDYFEADSNFNVILNPAETTYAGRTIMGKVLWPINDGPVLYALTSPEATRITVNGVNYVRQIENEVNPNLIGVPTNPLGLTNGDAYEISKNFNKGIFAVNYTDWLDGRLDTIVGIRLNSTFSEGQQAGDPYNNVSSNTASFDVGADYRLLSWLRAYVDASDSYDPPQIFGHDPVGNLAQISHGIGGEAGLKFNNPSGTISGSIAIYHTEGTNEQAEISSTIENDINPDGLNGRPGPASTYIDVDRESQGLQVALTANPVPNWRMRLSAGWVDGTIQTTKAYPQLYNDQFYENSAGQVTYANGTVVYVNPTYNASQPTVSSTTPGAIPLTVAMMNNPASPYYANPENPTGQINPSSAVATVLQTVSPTNGPILTGAVGLPISDLQVTPTFSLPGTIVTEEAGDRTLGYPELSFSFTNVYTFDSGWWKGFEIGGTLSAGWDEGMFYYYPEGFPASARTLFTAPVQGRVDLITGYTYKFKRFTWTTQINIDNMFNHYYVMIYPNEETGWTAQQNLSAAFLGQPRTWLWTNTVSF